MADLRISDLAAASSVQLTDLIVISQDDGDGTYTSKKIEAQNFDVFGGSRNFGPREDNPTSPSPVNGDIYFNTIMGEWIFYDASRGEWLTIDSQILDFGRGQTLGSGNYYRSSADTISYSATSGHVAAWDGVIVGLGYTRDDADQADFGVTANGVTVAAVTSTATNGSTMALDGDFSAGDIIGVRNDGPNATTSAYGWVVIRFKGIAAESASSSSSSGV